MEGQGRAVLPLPPGMVPSTSREDMTDLMKEESEEENPILKEVKDLFVCLASCYVESCYYFTPTYLRVPLGASTQLLMLLPVLVSTRRFLRVQQWAQDMASPHIMHGARPMMDWERIRELQKQP